VTPLPRLRQRLVENQTKASGWPEWVGDDETKRQQYIREYEEHEGILLEYDKIKYNAGLRALAKMMLNSMWGKFGQRLNKTQVVEFSDPQAFHCLLLDIDTLGVRHVSIIKTTSWKSTINTKRKTSLRPPISTSSWPISPPLGRVA